MNVPSASKRNVNSSLNSQARPVISSAVLDHQLPASGPWSPTWNAPASGLSFHILSVHPAMKPSARSGLQAVGSLWLMATCLVVVAVPAGVTAVSVTSYSPSNVKRADTLSPLNVCPVLVSQYAMEEPGVLFTNTIVLASSPASTSRSGAGILPRRHVSSLQPCSAMAGSRSPPTIALRG